MAKKEIPTEICLWCKQPFPKVRTNKVYCHPRCKIYDHLKKKREEKKKDKKDITD